MFNDELENWNFPEITLLSDVKIAGVTKYCSDCSDCSGPSDWLTKNKSNMRCEARVIKHARLREVARWVTEGGRKKGPIINCSCCGIADWSVTGYRWGGRMERVAGLLILL